jgi:hypothetical protein
MTSKKITVNFAPGAFDSFEGTQEELDNLMAEIVQMAKSGELLEQGEIIDFDQLIEDDNEIAEHLTDFISNTTRTLQ